MKTFILAALAATVAVGPLAATAADAAPWQSRETTSVRHQPGRTVVTQRTVTRRQPAHSWRAGDRFDRRQAQSYRRINDWRASRLAAPRAGTYWARSGRDAVLVRDNGTVVTVRTATFR